MENKKDKVNFDCGCKNCKFFVLHYVKHKSKFFATGFGHCNKRKLKHAINLEETINCSFKEVEEQKSDIREKTVKQILKGIGERLNDIKDLLSCDT